MGYQESYLRPRNYENWDKLIDHLKDSGKEYYKYWGCYPAEIITFTENHFPFKKGQKFIYFVGERYPQTYRINILLRSGYLDKQEEFEEKYGYKNLIKYDFDSEDFINTDIYFTEEVDPVGIWPDSGEVTDVIHEPFTFD